MAAAGILNAAKHVVGYTSLNIPYRLSSIQYPDATVKNYCAEAELASDYVFDKYYHKNDATIREEEWREVKNACNALFEDMIVQCDKDKGECRPDWYRDPAKINNKDSNCHLKLLHYCALAIPVRYDPTVEVSLPDFSRPANINSCIGGGVKLKKKVRSRVPGHDELIIFDNVSTNNYANRSKSVIPYYNPEEPNYIAALGRGLSMEGHGSVLRCNNGNCNKFFGCLALDFNSLGLSGENYDIAIKNSILPYPHGIWSTENKDAMFKTRKDLDPVNRAWNQELSILCRAPVQMIVEDTQREITILSCAVGINDISQTDDSLRSIYKVELRRRGGFDDVSVACSLIYENSPTKYRFCTDGFEVFVNMAGFLSTYGAVKTPIPFINPTVNPPVNVAAAVANSIVRSSYPYANIH